jgi:hypothetical protein
VETLQNHLEKHFERNLWVKTKVWNQRKTFISAWGLYEQKVWGLFLEYVVLKRKGTTGF